MATHDNTPDPGVLLDPTTLMLARLFPKWKGDTSEPALPLPPRPPAPPSAVAAMHEPERA